MAVNPITNMLSALDSINSTIYTYLSQDPLLGALTKALPPPPKISTAFAQLPALPGLPTLPSASAIFTAQQEISKVQPTEAQFG